VISKWQWMMDYCKSNFLPPAQAWAWEEARKAYEEFINSKVQNKSEDKNETI
jgi:hypothetical protein